MKPIGTVQLRAWVSHGTLKRLRLLASATRMRFGDLVDMAVEAMWKEDSRRRREQQAMLPFGRKRCDNRE